MVPGRLRAGHGRRARRADGGRRHDHRRRQLLLPRRHRPRRRRCEPQGIHYVDVGTSGGVCGLERGYCLMIGGARRGGAAARPDLRDDRPGDRRRAERTPGRERRADAVGERLPALRPLRRRPLREDGPQRDRVRRDGRLRRGPQHPQARRRRQRASAEIDAETTPLARSRVLPLRPRPHGGRRGLAPRQRDRLLAARPDRRGAASTSPDLEEFGGRVSDSGEGRWTLHAAIDEGVPAPVLSSGAATSGSASRGEDEFANKLLSAMRKQFGGHDEKPPEDADS